MRTSEVLNTAADLIEARGWTTGNIGMSALADAPLCLEGAIAAVMGVGTTPFTWACGVPTDPPPGTLVYHYAATASCPAYAAVKSHLATEDDLWHWNDDEAESVERVIEVLRATAIIEAAKEDEALAAEFLTWQGSEISA